MHTAKWRVGINEGGNHSEKDAKNGTKTRGPDQSVYPKVSLIYRLKINAVLSNIAIFDKKTGLMAIAYSLKIRLQARSNTHGLIFRKCIGFSDTVDVSGILKIRTVLLYYLLAHLTERLN